MALNAIDGVAAASSVASSTSSGIEKVSSADDRSTGSQVCTKVMSFDSASRSVACDWVRSTVVNAIEIETTRMPLIATAIRSSGSVKPASRRRR